jgi:soluble lytic murein transglycosylase-like protein
MKNPENLPVPCPCIRSLPIVMLGSLLSFFLIPSHPFEAETAHRVDEINSAQVQNIYETSKIYSILTSDWTELSESHGWSIANAILTESRRHSLDPILILAVIHVESRFSPTAVSKDGARGLMQIRPAVAAGLAEEANMQDWEGEGSLADPILNIKLGIFYLGQLKKNFKDLKLALTAYNLGPTVLRQRLEERDEIPFTYAKKVFSTRHAYSKQKPQGETSLPIHWGKAKI